MWSSSAPAVATVDTAGLVRAVAPGEVSVSASVGAKTGALAIAVTVWPVVRVAVTPAVDSLLVGDTLRLRAAPLDSLGDTLADRPVVWRTSDSSKAEVSATGLVRARAEGGFAVTAESEGQRGGAFLSTLLRAASLVLPDTVTLDSLHPAAVTALVRSAGGVRLAGRPVAWSVADPAVAVVDGLGVVSGRGTGSTRLRASCCGGLADSAVIRVVLPPVIHLWISFTGWTVLVDSSVDATADPTDSLGYAIAAPVGWSSSDSTVLRVTPDSTGARHARVTALRPGTAWIAASAGGHSASNRLTAVLPIRRLQVEPETVTARIGQWVRVIPTLQDSTGAIRDPAPAVSIRTLDTSIAGSIWNWEVVEVQGRRAGTTKAIVEATAAGVRYEDTVRVVVPRSGAPSLAWDPPLASAPSYSAMNAAVEFLDSAGAIPATGTDVLLGSSDTSVATVTPALLPDVRGRAPVMIHFRRPGSAHLVARTDSVSAGFSVVVNDAPAVTLKLTAPAVVDAGDSALLAVAVRDQDWRPHEFALTWSTSDPAVAVVREGGFLVGLTGGRVVVAVETQNLRDTATVIVRSPIGLVIDSVGPALLLADSAAAILGSGFDADLAHTTVTVDGVPAAIMRAAAQRLDIRLPPGAAFPCGPTHSARITVASGGALAMTAAPFSAARQLRLAVGDSVRLSGPDGVRCNHLTPSATQYLITVANQARSADEWTRFVAVGSNAELTSATSGRAASASPGVDGRGVAIAPGTELPAKWRDRALHRRILEESRLLARHAGSPVPLLRARPRVQASVADSVGPLVRFRIPRVDRPGFCSDYRGVVARKAFHGQHIDIYEDVASAYAGQMDTAFARLGDEFDATMFPILVADFGDPLVLDSLLDRSGRITFLVSPQVNPFASAFVVSCDFYPESVAPSSNTGETIYAFAPWETGPGIFPGSLAYWQWTIRSVLMHESKHVASFAQRLVRGAPLEDTWLEEGSAVIAEELWSRTIYHTTWRGNAEYASTLACDVRPHEPACAGRPYAMFNAFANLEDYARPGSMGNEVHTPLGPTSGSDGSFYGSAWSLLRWSIDHYASDESAFLHALVEDPTRTGVANLEVRTGRAFPALVADWLLASLSETGVLAWPLTSPPYTHPSWNLGDIFSGMARDFPQDFVARPFGVHLAMGVFDFPVLELRGGAASTFAVGGLPMELRLELRSLDGGAPPGGLELRIIRTR